MKFSVNRELFLRPLQQVAGVVERLVVVRPIALLRPFISTSAEGLIYVSGLAMMQCVGTFLLCMNRLDRVWDAAEEDKQDTSNLVPSLPVELVFQVFNFTILGKDCYRVAAGDDLEHEVQERTTRYAITLTVECPVVLPEGGAAASGRVGHRPGTPKIPDHAPRR